MTGQRPAGLGMRCFSKDRVLEKELIKILRPVLEPDAHGDSAQLSPPATLSSESTVIQVDLEDDAASSASANAAHGFVENSTPFALHAFLDLVLGSSSHSK